MKRYRLMDALNFRRGMQNTVNSTVQQVVHRSGNATLGSHLGVIYLQI